MVWNRGGAWWWAAAAVVGCSGGARHAEEGPPFLPPEAVVMVEVRPAQLVETPLARLLAGAFIPPEDPVEGRAAIPLTPREPPAELRALVPRARKVERCWVYFDGVPSGTRPSGVMFVVRGREPLSTDEVEEWLGGGGRRAAETEGKTFVALPDFDGLYDSRIALHQADPNTVLLGPQNFLVKALAASPRASALAEEVSARKFHGQIRVMAVRGAHRPLLERAAAALAQGTPAVPYAELAPSLPKLVSASLELDLVGPRLWEVDLASDDAAASIELHAALAQAWENARVSLGASARQALEAKRIESATLLSEVSRIVSVSQEGSTTSVVLARPGKLEGVVQSSLADAVADLRSPSPGKGEASRADELRSVLAAMHMAHLANGRWPGDVRSRDGEALFSWRALILPYLEQRFDPDRIIHWNEPWDSKLNIMMGMGQPRIRVLTGRENLPRLTSTFALTGPGTIHPAPGKTLSLQDVKDGVSDTICLIVVRPEWAVPILKPGDLAFDPDKMNDLLQALPAKDILVGYFDGHVETWKQRPTAETLKALVTIAGGETAKHPE